MKTEEIKLNDLQKIEKLRFESLKVHDAYLASIIKSECYDQGIKDEKTVKEIVSKGIGRFAITNQGKIRVLYGEYDLTGYVDSQHPERKAKNVKQKAVQTIDDRAAKKAELYEMLVAAAKAHDQKAYRIYRKEYSAL